MSLGIIIVSHVDKIAAGVQTLISQVAADVSVTIAGGTDDGGVGTSVEKIQQAISDNKADEILAFYDLGSAKMNLELAQDFSDKPVHLYDVALVEGAYTAAALLQAGVDRTAVEAQLADLKIK
ncbi:dihydroxyacetone kinase phosphoryl donor subunit DhaM [Loigolactobacillus jiayinensis]|uniref:phosphoenolpyruvate--glycerone phosphotransferase n=1 Tax=Loigolactobacillus jiayinensis TaxID=2486016 RepID=A0ABW1RKQ2_9LACO|nr:dihydroxyacetone kinase phosphoryl donor subunit DhaM [Loigolactobacillus jiayinensis]